MIPANTAFGLLAALLWGGGDFSGGMASKHSGGTIPAALRIILISHSTSLCILLAAAFLRHDAFPDGAPLIWALTGGSLAALSLICFYIALARGAMGPSAAVSGLLAAAIPAIVAMATDGLPGPLRLAGFLTAGLAIWIVAAAPTGVLESSLESGTPRTSASTISLAAVAGAGFGFYFVELKMAGKAGVLWPAALCRTASITTCLLLATILLVKNRKQPRAATMPRVTVWWALSTAALDTGGNLFFISSTRAGRLDVAAVLASLYPATTIFLAALLLKESLSRRQWIGMGAAVVAVIMITV